MRKFRNKLTGVIAEQILEDSMFYMTSPDIIHKTLLEESTEWEDISEPTFQILSFSCAGRWEGNLATLDNEGRYALPSKNSWSLLELLEVGVSVKSGQVEIHSVKRLSDGEVFTVGDSAKDTKYGVQDTIASLRITNCGSSIYVSTKNLSWGQPLENIERVKPFFITYDGVEVKEGAEVFFVSCGCAKMVFQTILYKEVLQYTGVKIFSTRDAAEEYVERNTELFKTEDGVSVFPGSTYWCVNTAPHLWSLFEQTAKDRTKLNKTVLAFSTKELAENYLLMNKNLLSLEDILSVWGDDKDKANYANSRLFMKLKGLALSKNK